MDKLLTKVGHQVIILKTVATQVKTILAVLVLVAHHHLMVQRLHVQMVFAIMKVYVNLQFYDYNCNPMFFILVFCCSALKVPLRFSRFNSCHLQGLNSRIKCGIQLKKKDVRERVRGVGEKIVVFCVDELIIFRCGKFVIFKDYLIVIFIICIKL